MQQPTASCGLQVAAVIVLIELLLHHAAHLVPAGNCSALYVLTRLNQQRFEVRSIRRSNASQQQ